jgi:hypothetical protein
MNLVAILVAPLAIQEIAPVTRLLIFLACLLILGFSVAFSKRGSIAEEEPAPERKVAEASK